MTSDAHRFNEYVRVVTVQRNYHKYHQLRALYLKEILSPGTFRMAARVLQVANIRDKRLSCDGFVFKLVKDLLMNEFELAFMTFFLWQSREDSIESLELLVLLCGYHSKAILTSELAPIQVYLEREYPFFSPAQYKRWHNLHSNVHLAPKKLNTIYRQLSTPGSLDDFIENITLEYADSPGFPVPNTRKESGVQWTQEAIRPEVPPAAILAQPVVESYLEPAVVLQRQPSQTGDFNPYSFDIDDQEMLLRHRSFDGGQNSFS